MFLCNTPMYSTFILSYTYLQTKQYKLPWSSTTQQLELLCKLLKCVSLKVFEELISFTFVVFCHIAGCGNA